jgi:hypothetical protein
LDGRAVSGVINRRQLVLRNLKNLRRHTLNPTFEVLAILSPKAHEPTKDQDQGRNGRPTLVIIHEGGDDAIHLIGEPKRGCKIILKTFVVGLIIFDGFAQVLTFAFFTTRTASWRRPLRAA